MSFILDALKKSESERQRQAGPALLEMRIIPPSRKLPAWAIVVGAVLVVSVGVLGWLALRSHPAPPTQARQAAVPAGVAQIASASPDASREAAGAPPVPAPLPRPAAGNGVDAGNAIDANAPEENAADNEPAVTSQSPLQSSAGDAAKLHNYTELNGTVPELRLDLHVYAANPADRYAFINMHKVREGDTTPEGAHVQQITRDGVVLDYNGSEFLLGRQ